MKILVLMMFIASSLSLVTLLQGCDPDPVSVTDTTTRVPVSSQTPEPITAKTLS